MLNAKSKTSLRLTDQKNHIIITLLLNVSLSINQKLQNSKVIYSTSHTKLTTNQAKELPRNRESSKTEENQYMTEEIEILWHDTGEVGGNACSTGKRVRDCTINSASILFSSSCSSPTTEESQVKSSPCKYRSYKTIIISVQSSQSTIIGTDTYIIPQLWRITSSSLKQRNFTKLTLYVKAYLYQSQFPELWSLCVSQIGALKCADFHEFDCKSWLSRKALTTSSNLRYAGRPVSPSTTSIAAAAFETRSNRHDGELARANWKGQSPQRRLPKRS